MRTIAPETPLYEILGARAPLLRRLEKLGVRTAGDLLRHFPFRYEDFSKIYSIAELEPGQQATVQGVIEEVDARRSWRRGMTIVTAMIADGSGTVRAVWFNQPYVANVLKTGRTANFAGKVTVSDEGELYLSNPAYEVLRLSNTSWSGTDEADDVAAQTRHTARLVPIYPETRGLTSRGIRFAIQQIFRRKPHFEEWLPPEVLSIMRFPELNEALHSIHFPKTTEEAAEAKNRFSFEDLFLLQLWNLEQKIKLAAEKAPPIYTDIERVKALLAALPFELTPSQKKSLWEIIKDLERPRPMNRLLQGDVGSGKTIVAAIAALIARRNGFQTAFMAPTEILARQHFETMKKLIALMQPPAGAAGAGAPEAPPVIGLLTGTNAVVFYGNDLEGKTTKQEFQKKIAAGEVEIVFGTHALIEKGVAFRSLGLVVIDEQHRFGVTQRAELVRGSASSGAEKGAAGAKTNSARSKRDTLLPHFLSMSATPIPRTLMLSIFGDLDLSLINELPAGRKATLTKIVSPIERQATYDFIRSEVKSGRQVFVICPRIEPEDAAAESANSGDGASAAAAKPEKTDAALRKKLDLKSVKEEYERLSQKIFPDLRVAMLHGQMKPKEKEEVMRAFKDRTFDILVSTSVVEVGVDIPNATIMMIEGADRFGLAQLYQFRGRVGRGEHQSYCFLMSDATNGTAAARLHAILEAKNGFELAEKDLALRGPGQFFGEAQTGLPDIAMEALRDPELVKGSRDAAVAVIQKSPNLAAYPLLRKKMARFAKEIHRE